MGVLLERTTERFNAVDGRLDAISAAVQELPAMISIHTRTQARVPEPLVPGQMNHDSVQSSDSTSPVTLGHSKRRHSFGSDRFARQSSPTLEGKQFDKWAVAGPKEESSGGSKALSSSRRTNTWCAGDERFAALLAKNRAKQKNIHRVSSPSRNHSVDFGNPADSVPERTASTTSIGLVQRAQPVSPKTPGAGPDPFSNASATSAVTATSPHSPTFPGSGGYFNGGVGSAVSGVGGSVFPGPGAATLAMLQSGGATPSSGGGASHGGPTELETPGLMLRPSSRIRVFLDSMLVIVACISALAAPMFCIYTDPSEMALSPAGLLLHVLDGLWFIGMCLSFRTAVFVDGLLLVDPWLVGCRYCRKHFLTDLLSIVPLVLADGQRAIATVVVALKVLRVFQLRSMLLRLHILSRLAMAPLKAVLYLVYPLHLLCCGWRLLLVLTSDELAFAGGGAGWGDDYVCDLYWLLGTMAGVGYGDITPTGTATRLYAILVMFAAPIVLGAVVASCVHHIPRYFEDKREGNIADIESFMRRRCVPRELQVRVVHNLRHNLGDGTVMRAVSLDPDNFNRLAPTLQQELSLMLLRDTLPRFPLFRGTLRGFVAEIALAHSWVQCLPDDLVAEEKQLVQEVVFVVEGCIHVRPGSGCNGRDWDVTEASLEAILANGGGVPMSADLGTGAWFGEACLFDSRRIRLATFLAVVLSDLAILPASEYFRVLQKYPSLQTRHKCIERSIAERTARISDFAYKP
eukprot:TRINITY_DN4307_c0_g1_i5.p1 TRINITY_DN4307_c0_g1~~TRINITY_DN4307_c0_g1_i5.p1  ORF type:complete len:803 (+),score=137.26 TRINITY_DN4307_c0_g1_i5:177-2411(+)